MKEHQNVHQVINQAPTVLGLPLYRKATTPTHSPPTNRTVSLAARWLRQPLSWDSRLAPFTPRKQGAVLRFWARKGRHPFTAA